MEPNCQRSASDFLKYIYSILKADISEYSDHRVRLKLPLLTPTMILTMLEEVTTIFMSEETVVKVSSPLVIVGDLHGTILDFLKILSIFSFPPNRKYLFLGDLVNKGEFSTEIIAIVFAMKSLYPESVIIVRGNHEFASQCEQCGFYEELTHLYGDDTTLPAAFSRAFSYIPLGAIIDNSVLCVHGGIGPSITDISTIKSIPRPITNFKSGLATEIMWSDPSESLPLFLPSNRGLGYLFGHKALSEFLKKSHLSMLIRGHQTVEEGIKQQFGGQLVTVFSSSQPSCKGKPGVLIMESKDSFHPYIFDAIPNIKRCDVALLKCSCDASFSLPHASSQRRFSVSRLLNIDRRTSITPHSILTQDSSRNNQTFTEINTTQRENKIKHLVRRNTSVVTMNIGVPTPPTGNNLAQFPTFVKQPSC